MDVYQNYELDCYLWELSDKDKEFLDAVIWLIDNKKSIRFTGKNWLISKSSLHRFIHSKLRKISYELYCVCMHQLRQNKSKYFK